MGLVNETAEQLENLPPDTSPQAALCHAHSGIAALNLGVVVMSGNVDQSRLDEFTAATVLAHEAHEEITEVVDDDLFGELLDMRVIELLDQAEQLRRMRVSVRWLRTAMARAAEATHSVLAGLATSDDPPSDIRAAAETTAALVADMRMLIDGPARERAALAELIKRQAVIIKVDE
ncbi:hypothetical protein CRH09_39870 (plasmid) [Nocardia terpenica]|uniref:Uncharacterized protein n=1 Tax=Nocardia terpenica TaxID=455432 RepID=A0A291RYX9_9NOCA|nr:hypothetical protein CRH09_39870 [Nocardia terpenica]